MVGVARILGLGNWDVCRVGVGERVLETLHEVDWLLVLSSGRYGDPKVAAAVGAGEERLGKALLYPKAFTGRVSGSESPFVLDSMVADRAVCVVFLELETWDGAPKGGRALELRLGCQDESGLELLAVFFGDFRVGLVPMDVGENVIRIDHTRTPNANQDPEGEVDD